MPVKNPFKHWQTAVVNAFKVKRQQTKSAMHRIRIVSPSQNCQQIFRFGSARVPAGTVIKYHGQRTQLLKQTARSVFQNTQGRFLAHFFKQRGIFKTIFRQLPILFRIIINFPKRFHIRITMPCMAFHSSSCISFFVIIQIFNNKQSINGQFPKQEPSASLKKFNRVRPANRYAFPTPDKAAAAGLRSSGQN